LIVRAAFGGFLSRLLLFVESLADFLFVALVVQLEEPLEDFATGGFADGEADALLGFVEAVAEVEGGVGRGGGGVGGR
jgi:hypothetical protein